MSLALKLKQFNVAKVKGEKVARVEFRGMVFLGIFLSRTLGEKNLTPFWRTWPTPKGTYRWRVRMKFIKKDSWQGMGSLYSHMEFNSVGVKK